MGNDISDKFNFVINRLSNMEERIKVYNKAGFFDEAKISELLAKDICQVLFDKKFICLNTEKEFPYADLKAEDNSFFVQVSTEKNVSAKIKNTLTKLRASQSKGNLSIKKIKFFFFSSSTNITKNNYNYPEFDADKDIITIDRVIKRCKADGKIIIKLYNILKQSEDLNIAATKNFEKVMETSKVFLEEIDTTLDGKFEIQRESLISKIENSTSSVIALIGNRGIGKKVLIKKLHSDSIIIIPGTILNKCATAEDIIGIDIPTLATIMKLDKYYICITDIDNIELSDTVKVIVRKLISDIKASIKFRLIITLSQDDLDWHEFLFSNDSVEQILVPPLSASEISVVVNTIPRLAAYASTTKFIEIMRIPLFLSILIKYSSTQQSYSDLNQFYNSFWRVISKNNNKRITVLKFIAKQSCMNEALDVNCDDCDSEILKDLTSDGIILESDGRYRFKHSYFEELVWYHIFSAHFWNSLFSAESFSDLNYLGKQIDKYYEAWISERLFFDDNLCSSLWSKLQRPDYIPPKWLDLTVKGIVKSDYSGTFLEKHINRIVQLNLLDKFIEATNLYAFHTEVLNQQSAMIVLKPCGSARPFLIRYLHRQELAQNKVLIRLCEDYLDYGECDPDIANIAVGVLLKVLIAVIRTDNLPSSYELYFWIAKTIKRIHHSYNEKSIEVINFIKSLKEICDSDYQNNMKAKLLANYILGFDFFRFTEDFPTEICNLADSIWKDAKNYNKENNHYSNNNQKYGLSTVSSYSGFSPIPEFCEYKFFIALLYTDFDRGLKWMISFINDAMDCFYKSHRKEIITFTIPGCINKSFYGNKDLWSGYTPEPGLPRCLNNILFSLRKYLFWEISSNQEDIQYINDFFKKTKDFIITNSNNIAPLGVLVSIGIVFNKIIEPKETLVFAFCQEFIKYDFQRQKNEALYINTCYTKESDSIAECRYGFHKCGNEYTCITLINFFQYERAYGDDSVKKLCNDILTSLYARTPNDEENQEIQYCIQCMDVEITDGQISHKGFTEYAAAYKQYLDSTTSESNEIINEIREAKDTIENNSISKDECLSIINKISSNSAESKWQIYGKSSFIQIMTYTLSHFPLSPDERNMLCLKYVNFFWDNSHTIDRKDICILYDQLLYKEITEESINAILDVLLYIVLCSYNIVYKLIQETISFLEAHEGISRRIFNTVLALSESINTQVNNKTFLSDINLNHAAREEGSLIIKKYLYHDNSIIIPDSLDNCDIAYLLRIFYSGTHINKENEDFFKKLWKKLINWTNNINSADLIKWFFLCASNFFNHEIRNKNGKAILSIIFSDIDYQNLSELSSSIFLKTLDLSLLFYDSYEDSETRKYVWDFIASLESIYNEIPNGGVKDKLAASLVLAPTSEPCWLNQPTFYYDDDIFTLIDQYNKYYMQYPLYVINSMYGLNISKLLPYVVGPLEKAISIIVDNYQYKNIPESIMETFYVVLKSIVSCPEKEKIMSMKEYYSSVMTIFEKLSLIRFPWIAELKEMLHTKSLQHI